MGVAELVKELAKDRAFYDSSGGGVTLSGGEPLAQAGFATAVLQRLKEMGIGTGLDTCGFAPEESLRQAVRATDVLLFDLKFIDRESHAAFTGQPNELILRNIILARALRDNGEARPRIWIRTPLIPGATATEDNITAIGRFIASHLDGALERWELCAFNNLCREQYKRLGMEWAYAKTPLYRRVELETMAEWARSTGVDPSRVFVTGATRESP
jgi:pyruvate formate lyase activating enzyme